MADYIASARSNYFRVKDVDALKADLERHGLDVGGWGEGGALVLDTGPDNKPEGAVALFSNADHGTWPVVEDEYLREMAYESGVACNAFVPEDLGEGAVPNCQTCGNEREKHTDDRPYAESLHMLVAAHLIDGEVAVFMETGAEKLRYVGGLAVAVNSKGETRTVDLDDIYEKAKEIGTGITQAVY